MKTLQPIEPKLKPGDTIQVHGWVMLNKMDEGKYRIVKISHHYDIPTYVYAKLKGKKTWSHYVSNVDPWIQDNNSNLNRIEILK